MAKRADKSKMACNKPRREVSGGKKFVVKACDKGKEKIVRFGDANMTIKKDNPKRRKSFRARHGCDTKKLDKLSARYWSCRMWNLVVFGTLGLLLGGTEYGDLEIFHALL
jgi:hypothetical protein